jgi:nucleotide-binding universal stress UspA family protein
VTASGLDADTLLAETVAQRTGDVIVDQAKAWPAEVIVLGTHGRRGVDLVFLGSDAERVARTASVPVLLVRAGPDPAQPADV